MTEPKSLSDADLLAWAVVLECRRQQHNDGIKIMLYPYPPCPTCGQSVTDAIVSWEREMFREDVTITMRPCGHGHHATFADVERIHPHIAVMLDELERKLPTPDALLQRARSLVGAPDETPVESATSAELTAEEARDLADDLGLELYRAQDALAFVEECCVIAERERRPITVADVREWLKGARCGRQLLAEQSQRTTANNSLTSSDTSRPLKQFVVWLDASDGSVPTHDGVQWPDGTVTIHHRHFGLTTTHHDAESATRTAHGGQGRIVWPDLTLPEQP